MYMVMCCIPDALSGCALQLRALQDSAHLGTFSLIGLGSYDRLPDLRLPAGQAQSANLAARSATAGEADDTL